MSDLQRKKSNKKSKLNQEKLTEEADILLDEIRSQPPTKKNKNGIYQRRRTRKLLI